MFSCTQKPKCDLAETIFTKPDSDSTLILELNEIFTYSDSVFNKICDRKTSEVLVKVADYYLPYHYYNYGFDNFPCGELPECRMPCKRINRLQVLVNRQNKVLFEINVVPLEQIDSAFVIAYLDLNDTLNEYQKKHVINVKWDVESSIDSLSKVLQKLAIGYSKVMERQLSDIEGDKCDFYLQNRDSLQRLYPVNLNCLFVPNLELQNKIPPPPHNWVD